MTPPVSTLTTGYAYLDEPRSRGHLVAMAHRGGARHPDVAGLENTHHAFSVAVGLGYRYLETDVHATRDGELMAFHDDRLERITDRAGRVDEQTAAEVSRALVGGQEPVPRLRDLLEAFPQARFNVDLKGPAAVDPMVDLVERMGLADRVCVGSFTESVIRRFRARCGRRVATSCGVLATTALVLPLGGHRLSPLARDRGAVFQVPHRRRGIRVVDAAFVRHAHQLGRQVHVWTVDERDEMDQLIDLGVDGLITDRTDVLREVLLARGLWEGP